MNIPCGPSWNEVVQVMDQKNMVLFTGNGMDVNLVSVRTEDLSTGTFNDWGFCANWNGAGWDVIQCQMTTDPGVFYRGNPLNVRGTLIMQPGQYRGAYQPGQFRGYTALRQIKPVSYWRVQPGFWSGSDLDPSSQPQETAVNGTHYHRAHDRVRVQSVGKFSAGCQVNPDPVLYRAVIGMVQEQKRAGNGGTCSYTLLDERDFHRLGA